MLSYMNLGEINESYMPQFYHMQNEENHSIYLIVLICSLNNNTWDIVNAQYMFD